MSNSGKAALRTGFTGFLLASAAIVAACVLAYKGLSSLLEGHDWACGVLLVGICVFGTIQVVRAGVVALVASAATYAATRTQAPTGELVIPAQIRSRRRRR